MVGAMAITVPANASEPQRDRDVPPVPGTPLDRARVRSTGWGGINSIWGAGVGDVYSLFFLVELAELTGDGLFASIAHLTAAGTAQLLSHPGELFGFADVGMQPEGIAFCEQVTPGQPR